MCIIVDANAVHDLANKTSAGQPVLRWLFSRSANVGLVVGGKLRSELIDAGLGATLRQLSEAGRLHRVSEEKLELQRKSLESSQACISNDVHIVALALVAECTVVFSKDRKLGIDLQKNCQTGKRIAIYKTARHAHLLTNCNCPKSAF